TDAKEIGFPLLSVTVPEIVTIWLCGKAGNVKERTQLPKAQQNTISLFFLSTPARSFSTSYSD
ncbi:MAG: hypothetical protein ACOCVA_08030, partial [Prolixibacteraceae bacterium]